MIQNMAHRPQPVHLTGSMEARARAFRPKGWAESVNPCLPLQDYSEGMHPEDADACFPLILAGLHPHIPRHPPASGGEGLAALARVALRKRKCKGFAQHGFVRTKTQVLRLTDPVGKNPAPRRRMAREGKGRKSALAGRWDGKPGDLFFQHPHLALE